MPAPENQVDFSGLFTKAGRALLCTPAREREMVDEVESVKNDRVALFDPRKKSERVVSLKGFNLKALIDACPLNRRELGFDGDVDCVAALPSLVPGAWRD
jgi:hypothetical protein